MPQEQQSAGEWIEWTGGECPVPAGLKIEAELRSGLYGNTTKPEKCRWRHLGMGGDIVRYRVVSA